MDCTNTSMGGRKPCKYQARCLFITNILSLFPSRCFSSLREVHVVRSVLTFLIISLTANSLPFSVPTNNSSCSTVSTAVFLRKGGIHFSKDGRRQQKSANLRSHTQIRTCVRCWSTPGCQGSGGTTAPHPVCRWRWRTPGAPWSQNRLERPQRAAPWSPSYRPQTACQTRQRPAIPHWTSTQGQQPTSKSSLQLYLKCKFGTASHNSSSWSNWKS